MDFPVFDLHCDTSNELMLGHELKENRFHIDLKKASQLDGYAQCFACFTTSYKNEDPQELFLRKKNAILRELKKNPNQISQVFTASQLQENGKNHKMSAILTIEGAAGIGFDPSRLEELYGEGFRITSLGWNEKNPLTGSHTTGGGLTDLGRAYVKECQRVGMLVDVSHISDEGFWDIMEMTQAPIVATHSDSRFVWNHSRNLTDEMFREICRSGGVAGINLYADFLGNPCGLETVCDHVFHWLELDPDGKHIALGGDLDGCERLPKGFTGIQDYPALARALLDRGLDEKTVRRIFWDNAFRTVQAAWR